MLFDRGPLCIRIYIYIFNNLFSYAYTVTLHDTIDRLNLCTRHERVFFVGSLTFTTVIFNQ
jgi:hypothetical protein